MQRPIDSGFGAASSAAEVLDGIDLSGKVAIVTGGHTGLGLETVRAFRDAAAAVVVPARDRGRATDGLSGVDGVEIAPMDLLDPGSIDAFASEFLAGGRPLHMLVNNAGVMMTPLARDARGYESHLATNHLGHFQLTRALWPALQRADGARVVNVSAWGHRHSDIVWDDPNYERRDYDPLGAYGQSKTANILHAVEIDRRGQADGIRAFSLHPGAIVTSVAEHLTVEELQALGLVDEHGDRIVDPARNMKNPQQGAATSVWCATSPQLDRVGGLYCQNCDVAPLVTDVEAAGVGVFGSTPLGVMPYAVNADSAARLWDLSEQLLG